MWRTSGDPVSPRARYPGWVTRADVLLSSVFCKLMIEAHFLPALELDNPAVVDHELDGPVANRTERLTQGQKERRREGKLLVGPGFLARREG